MSVDTDVDVDVEVITVPYEDTDDPSTRAHLVLCPDAFPGTSQDWVDLCRLHGKEVLALCGYRWVPKHNPERYPACEPCFEEASRRMNRNEE